MDRERCQSPTAPSGETANAAGCEQTPTEPPSQAAENDAWIEAEILSIDRKININNNEIKKLNKRLNGWC